MHHAQSLGESFRSSRVMQFQLKSKSLQELSGFRAPCNHAVRSSEGRHRSSKLRNLFQEQSILVAGLHRYGKNRIIDNGFLNFAIVTGFDDLLYFVVTDEKPNPNARRDWQHGLRTVTLPDMRKLPDVAEVQWVRHFTRFSQRRYGWGDALATKEEVQAAVDDENEAEVLAIMPKAATLVQRGELEHLPTVFEAMRSGLPALADCRHQLLSETMFAQQVPGPCGACGKVESDAYRKGFTKCGACDAVRCKPCAIEAMIQQDQRQSFLRAYQCLD